MASDYCLTGYRSSRASRMPLAEVGVTSMQARARFRNVVRPAGVLSNKVDKVANRDGTRNSYDISIDFNVCSTSTCARS